MQQVVGSLKKKKQKTKNDYVVQDKNKMETMVSKASKVSSKTLYNNSISMLSAITRTVHHHRRKPIIIISAIMHVMYTSQVLEGMYIPKSSRRRPRTALS